MVHVAAASAQGGGGAVSGLWANAACGPSPHRLCPMLAVQAIAKAFAASCCPGASAKAEALSKSLASDIKTATAKGGWAGGRVSGLAGGQPIWQAGKRVGVRLRLVSAGHSG